MKKINTILVTIVLWAVMTGCGGGYKQSIDDVITVDVTKNYPTKELILQDFLDVEYIPLESTNDFVTIANIQAIGKEFIITRNLFTTDGNIVFFDRTGKGLRTINRKGPGPEEYLRVGGVVGVLLDEDNNEFYVNDGMQSKIFVYDLFGNFKRSFPFKEGLVYSHIAIFDHDNLICHHSSLHIVAISVSNREYEKNAFWIISKQDGSVTKEIEIPYKERKAFYMVIDQNNGRTLFNNPVRDTQIVPYRKNWLLVEVSSDTIYRYLPDHSMIPFIVRTPSIQSMDPEVFLIPSMLTDRYFFMQSIKKVANIENREFPRTELMYDTQEKSIFETVVYNDDFSSKRRVSMRDEYGVTTLINSEEIVFAEKLEAYQLVEAYKEGKLKGKLKEIAAGLDEEDNAVIMIVKNKK